MSYSSVHDELAIIREHLYIALSSVFIRGCIRQGYAERIVAIG